MNNKGQVVMVLLMIFIVIVVLALALAPVLKQNNEDIRDVSSETAVGLDCSNSSISNWDKTTCTITDLSQPYFIFGLMAIGGLIVGAKAIGVI